MKKPAQKSKTKKAKATKGGLSLQLGKDIWPLERDVLFRPDRLKYVRKLVPQDGCVFCRAAKEPISFETLCVYKTEHSMIILNKFPYNTGHLLIVPLSHHGDINQLSDKAYMDLSLTLRRAANAVQQVYKPGGINMGLNQGAVAGAGIPEHLHYHLIPRWSGDLNFFPLIAETKVVVEGLETTFERLLAFFEKQGK